MGYFIEYKLELRILSKNKEKALQIFNYLHTDEMLIKYANGGRYPRGNMTIREAYWYSFVNNPKEEYKTLEEAFNNWHIVNKDVVCEVEKESGDFVVKGICDSKLGQQSFLLKNLACVLENTRTFVKGEDGAIILWRIKDYKYYEDNIIKICYNYI
jgi:hypothetical protein